MKKHMMLVVISLATIVGCKSTSDSVQDWSTVNAGKKPTNYEEKAKEKMTFKLKDPDSAQFKLIQPPHKEIITLNMSEEVSVWAVCGYVNAKNSYDGYTGFKPFMVSFKDDHIVHSYIISDSYKGTRCTSSVLSDPNRK
jgi:hypothetical protein